jgi:hypothetical protein
MMHGNAGQAAERDYVLSRMSDRILSTCLSIPDMARVKETLHGVDESGSVGGVPALRSRNQNAQFVFWENLSVAAPPCALAREKVAPDKIVLMVPFDSLASVASRRFYFLPVRLMLRDRWDNVGSTQALQRTG